MHSFTPGPWEITNHGTIDAKDRQIAMVSNGGLIDMPNARLIASAPDMLKALERIARPHDCGCKPCTSTCRNQIALEIAVEEIQELARAAIAKATGESA